jgi:sortase A
VTRGVLLCIAGVAAVTGAAGTGSGAYLYAKAELAQHLIERSWSDARRGGAAVAPWPWADTAPVARLSVPSQSVELYVLEGAHGSSLAFGPGWLAGSAVPGDAGNVVIAGHRDTHFRVLEMLVAGDVIELEPRTGDSVRYAVSSIEVTRSENTAPLQPTSANRLTLITCYPFDAILPGGPLRFVVVADGVE